MLYGKQFFYVWLDMFVMLSIHVTNIISITTTTFLFSWTTFSNITTILIIFLSFISLECSLLSFSFFCETALNFNIIFSLVFNLFFYKFFLTTSGTSLLSINTCNSLSISFFSEMALGYGHKLCTALGTKSDWLHANLIISYQKDTKPLTQDLTEYFSNEQCFLIKEVFEIYVDGSFIFWPKDLNFDSFTIK